jgi:nitroreductase
MLTSQSLLEIIHARRSHRSYERAPLPAGLLEQFRGRIGSPVKAPFGHTVRLGLISVAEAESRELKLGTYGVIRGAQTFLLGAVEDGPGALEDFGFVFEKAILEATGLRLGTCWLGGTFNRGAFADALGLKAGEVMPAVSPVGVPTDRRSLIDRTFRWAAGSNDRKPWAELFFNGDFQTPLTEVRAEKFTPVLEAVRRAPSASNKQPWRILRTAQDGTFHLFLQRTPGYKRLPVDLQRVDLGIALCHFELAARELALAGSWRSAPPAAPPPARTEYVLSWTGATDQDTRV